VFVLSRLIGYGEDGRHQPGMSVTGFTAT
jgi:hypothetical protein